MALRNGLYKVSFGTPLGEGFGVIVLRDGEVLGGDSLMFYVGDYEQDGDSFTASIEIGTHSTVPGSGSVFGVPSAQINLSGNTSSLPATVAGTSPQAPGLQFHATIQLLR